jgi:YD repeat-containing protein
VLNAPRHVSRTSLPVRLSEWKYGRPHCLPVRSGWLLMLMLVAIMTFGVRNASAEPMCTDSWTGANEGLWQTASNWSTGKVPSSSDVACIEAGKTVKVTEGTNQAGVLLDKGTVAMSGGTLEIVSALEASSADTLTITGGVLTGAGTLDISKSVTGGYMTGTGSTVVLPGASSTGSYALHESRALVNEGTMTIESGQTVVAESAKIKNTGTFKANAEDVNPAFYTESTKSSIVNTGTFEKTEGTGATVIEPSFENSGTVNGASGTLRFAKKSVVSLGASVLEGSVESKEAAFTGGNFNAQKATLTLSGGSLAVTGGHTANVGNLVVNSGGEVTGGGTLDISKTSTGAYMAGAGFTVILPGASESGYFALHESRVLVNEGTMTVEEGQTVIAENAQLRNKGTFKADSEFPNPEFYTESPKAFIVNTGLFEKTAGTGITVIDVNFENLGTIKEVTGNFEIKKPVYIAPSTQYGGGKNPSAPGRPCPVCGEPVTVATGNLSETQTDLAIGRRSVGLDLTRTYNSQAAAEGTKGPFGYGWSSSFSDRLFAVPGKEATLTQGNGSTVTFTELTGEAFRAPPWTQDTLEGSEETGFFLKLANQTLYKFGGKKREDHRLESIRDRNGNETTLTYNGSNQLTGIIQDGRQSR